MNQAQMAADDKAAIEKTMQTYADGAISGRSDDLKSAFHDNATIHGYVGPDLFAGPIQMFYDWHDENGAATNLKSNIVDIDIAGTIATVRQELDHWTGHRFTDMFTLLKTGGEWKIVSKVFYLHPEEQTL